MRSAHERFLAVGNQKQLAQVENNIAIALTMQHRFREAADLYEQALARAMRRRRRKSCSPMRTWS